MSSDLNRVMLIGRMTKDPELRYTPNGAAVANFSIANNRTWKQGDEKKEEASFFSCIAWSKLAELIVQYCKKGQQVGIEGRLQQRSWQDQEGNKRSTVEIVVENAQFLGKNESEEDITANIPNDNNPFSDEQIPF